MNKRSIRPRRSTSSTLFLCSERSLVFVELTRVRKRDRESTRCKQNEDGDLSVNQGPYGEPSEAKTFDLPHGRGSITVPENTKDKRKLSMKRDNMAGGSPFSPTGNPMADGVGAAAWAERRDVPELDGHGKPKIVPMRTLKKYEVSAGRDPRGMNVISADKKIVGKISDLWVDAPEQLVRYLEIELKDKTSCLLPMPLALIRSDGVHVNTREAFSKSAKNKSSNKSHDVRGG